MEEKKAGERKEVGNGGEKKVVEVIEVREEKKEGGLS